MGIQISKAQPEALKQVPSSSTDVEETSISTSQNPEVKDFSGTMADGHSGCQDLLAGQQASKQQSSLSSMGRHNSFEVTEMKKLNENAVQETAPSSAEQSADSCSELLETHADAVLPPDSNHSGIQVLNEAHDSWVRGDLDRALEYSEAHPGRVEEINVQERTLGIFPKDNGNEVIDMFEKQGFETWHALTKLCGRDVLAVWGKETVIRIKIKK